MTSKEARVKKDGESWGKFSESSTGSRESICWHVCVSVSCARTSAVIMVNMALFPLFPN